MELLFEIVFSIIFEGSIEGIKNKNIPMWLRIICGIIVSLLFMFVIGIIGFIAILMWKEYYHLPSILFLLIDLVFIIGVIKMVKKMEEKNKQISI